MFHIVGRSLAEGLQDYGTKWEEGRVVWRKLHIEELRDLHSSLHIARLSKYKNTSSVGRERKEVLAWVW